MNLKYRLYLSNIIYIVLLIILGVVYFSANSLVGDMQQEQTVNQDYADKLRKAITKTEQYLSGTATFEAAKNAFEELKGSSGARQDSAQLQVYWQNVDQYHTMAQRGREIEKALNDLTSQSIQQSNGYIKMVSQKLADENERNSVSKLERLVIIGASINTTSNYEIRVLFLKLMADSTQKQAILSFLDTLIANTAKDQKSLAGTDFEKMAVAAQQANHKIKILVEEFISLAEKETNIKNTLMSLGDKKLD